MKQTPNTYEKDCWSRNVICVGIDEAGRGPIAGPLVVAGVVFPAGYESGEIYDSKGITEKKREELFERIRKDAVWYRIEIVTPEIIDKYNIYRATQMTMEKIAADAPCEEVLTDAMPLPAVEKTVTPLVKGDQLSCSIAAGSILAKVTRDRIMKEYDAIYPQYGFAKHKGYPTKAHLEALHTYGLLPIYRHSYRPVAEMDQLTLDL
ncbi:MAG: ribonuclease HII [Erysipelotrichaceae bacterium]|nr:ribonuclease HII [Erysipelotrichaceae bacterium]